MAYSINIRSESELDEIRGVDGEMWQLKELVRKRRAANKEKAIMIASRQGKIIDMA